MFSRLMPTEGRFFELFVEHAEQILEASRELTIPSSAFIAAIPWWLGQYLF